MSHNLLISNSSSLDSIDQSILFVLQMDKKFPAIHIFFAYYEYYIKYIYFDGKLRMSWHEEENYRTLVGLIKYDVLTLVLQLQMLHVPIVGKCRG